jgi:hypothetical protein
LTYLERQTSYGPDKLRREEAEEAEAEEAAEEAEEKIRLKQYVSRRGDIIISRSLLFSLYLHGAKVVYGRENSGLLPTSLCAVTRKLY